MQIRIAYRRVRVFFRQLAGKEPVIPCKLKLPLEFHGSDYGGWPIVANSLTHDSVIVDIGLGEDISFSESLMDKYRCRVFGFDPTPRAIDYVRGRNRPDFTLLEVGVAAVGGEADFFLPNNVLHVSGSLFSTAHVGRERITVSLIPVEDIRQRIGADRIDLLKLDIEGAEFDLLDAPGFPSIAAEVNQICIEFHHRWAEFGKAKTISALKRLETLGFSAAWVSPSNEEALFVRVGAFA